MSQKGFQGYKTRKEAFDDAKQKMSTMEFQSLIKKALEQKEVKEFQRLRQEQIEVF